MKFLLKLLATIASILIAYVLIKLVPKEYKINVLETWLWCPALIGLMASGQFDTIPILFAILSLYLLKQCRYKLSGLSLAISTLLKQFTILIVPPIIAYVSYRRKWNFIITYLATILLITTPFILYNPKIFIDKVIMYHINRPPCEISLLHLVKILNNINEATYNQLICIWSYVYATIYVIQIILALKHGLKNFNKLLTILSIILLTMIIINKVLFQYYLVWFCPLIYITSLNKGKRKINYTTNTLTLLTEIQATTYVLSTWNTTEIINLGKHIDKPALTILHRLATQFRNIIEVNPHLILGTLFDNKHYNIYLLNNSTLEIIIFLN